MTGDPPPGGPAPAPGDADPLAGFLRLAQREGALEGEGLGVFMTSLRERAELVIADRLGRLETKLRALETENNGKREAIAALETERAWLRQTIENLEGVKARQGQTVATLEADAVALRRAVEAAGEERNKASAAHESLLTHHRELMARLASQLDEIAGLSPLRAREIRRRLRALADLLRADSL